MAAAISSGLVFGSVLFTVIGTICRDQQWLLSGVAYAAAAGAVKYVGF